MKNYRLKQDAVPFFQKDIATRIHDLDTWKSHNVDINALEEVEEAFITYGFEKKEYSSLCGWSTSGAEKEDVGSRFHFTLHFPSMKMQEHDKFSNGKVIRELMDKLQRDVNYFYQEYMEKPNK